MKARKRITLYVKSLIETMTDVTPNDFLFLLRTCMNGLVRFNERGDFNTSFHIGRPGIHPDKMDVIIDDWNRRISHTVFLCDDYRNVLYTATDEDIAYLDPPYLNTKGMYGESFPNQTLWECPLEKVMVNPFT